MNECINQRNAYDHVCRAKEQYYLNRILASRIESTHASFPILPIKTHTPWEKAITKASKSAITKTTNSSTVITVALLVSSTTISVKLDTNPL